MLRLLLALGAAEGARACCWCDEATPKEAQITVGLDKKGYDLVFSDEFDHPHRTRGGSGPDSPVRRDARHDPGVVQYEPGVRYYDSRTGSRSGSGESYYLSDDEQAA